MKTLIICLLLLTTIDRADAQDRYFTKTGKIRIQAVDDADVNATTRSAVLLLDTKQGSIEFTVLVKGFEFEKALMQEKFNHKIMESDKYPQSVFKGAILDNSSVNYHKPGTYSVEVSGELTMHGVTRKVSAKGSIVVTTDSLQALATFTVMVADYQLSNPGVGETIRIDVECALRSIDN